MRNKGYSKCDDTTKCMRDICDKKYNKILGYNALKRICKCASRDIMKIRKYCKTEHYTFNLERHYFNAVFKGDIIDLVDTLFNPYNLKYHNRTPRKYKIKLELRD